MSTANKIPTENDVLMVHEQFDDLMEACVHIRKESDKELLQNAFSFANKAHYTQVRKTGEPFICHPIEVARIAAAEFRLDAIAIASALLHDVVEDTKVTIEHITKEFGAEIAIIIEGLTKIENVYDQESNLQAENLKKILLSITVDIRIVMLKLADRLHNMRTLHGMGENRQVVKAGEVLYVYAPLAHRLGMHKIKNELEDISFRYLHPEEYHTLTNSLEESSGSRERTFSKIRPLIADRLKEAGIKCRIETVTRSVFSVWKQMRSKGLRINQVPNLLSVRIIFKPQSSLPENSLCWSIYGLIDSLFPTNIDKIQDWVNHPRSNGYEALHGAILVDETWIAVQIRTERMHDVAELGYAVYPNHYIKTGKNELTKWVERLSEELENPSSESSSEFLDDVKSSLYSSDIYLFTPRGQIKTLPKGATVLDFAYDIHSELGNKCIGAMVNHISCKVDHVLHSGDEVKILTLESQKPQPDWLDFVVTHRAKTVLKSTFRNEHKEDIKKGKQVLDEIIAELKLKPSSRLQKRITDAFRYRFKDELYYKIGTGIIEMEDIKIAFSERPTKKTEKYTSVQVSKLMSKIGLRKSTVNGKPVINKKLPLKLTESFDLSYVKMAECCNPIPGDDVLAYQHADGVIVIHKRDCETSLQIAATGNLNPVTVEWKTHKIEKFLVRIEVKGNDRPKLLREIANVIANMKVDIKGINMEGDKGLFFGSIDCFVHCIEDVNNLKKQLSKIKNIKSVTRIKLSNSHSA